MRQLPTVRDYMDTKLWTLGADATIGEAIKFILKHRISSALVVDEDMHLLGIVSEKDCLELVATGDHGDAATGVVENYMTREVETISPDVDIYYVAGLFLKRTFRRFPIVEDGVLIGHITRRDILRIVQGRLERPVTGDINL